MRPIKVYNAAETSSLLGSHTKLLVVFNASILSSPVEMEPVAELHRLEKAGYQVAVVTSAPSTRDPDSQENRKFSEYFRDKLFPVNQAGLRMAMEWAAKTPKETIIIENEYAHIPEWRKEGVFIAGYIEREKPVSIYREFTIAGVESFIARMNELNGPSLRHMMRVHAAQPS